MQSKSYKHVFDVTFMVPIVLKITFREMTMYSLCYTVNLHGNSVRVGFAKLCRSPRFGIADVQLISVLIQHHVTGN